MADLITSSRLKTFHDCQRLHHIQYDLGYRPLEDGEALVFGTLMHAGLEAWWLAFKANAPENALDLALTAIAGSRPAKMDDATFARAEILMRGYHARWAPEMDAYEVLVVEHQFRAAIRGLRGMRLGGKVDVIVRKRADGTKWLIEHKTTSADLAPGSSYWTRLRLDGQVSIYHDGAAALGHVVDGCIYDVIKKPELRPYKATPIESQKRTKDGRLYANQREFDETPEEFQARMAEAITADPTAYYQRAEVVRLDTEMDAARSDVVTTALEIQTCARKGWFPRNTGHCFAYGGKACPFADVCAGAASLDDTAKFKHLANVNPELETE